MDDKKREAASRPLDYRAILILAMGVATIIGFLFIPAIPQNTNYHLFSDQNTIMGIPHFWNTISNLPFIWFGVVGLIKTYNGHLHIQRALYPILSIFYAGILCVGLGSGYYHLNPNNLTLVWDRLPMTIGFMALVCVVVADYISVNAANKMVTPLVLLGVLSVGYWYITESMSQGDLRPYALVQFLPMLIIPVILLTYQHPYTSAKGYWLLIACYFVAKLLEHFDAQIHTALGIMSGHPLKHLIAAAGIALFTHHLNHRRLRES